MVRDVNIAADRQIVLRIDRVTDVVIRHAEIGGPRAIGRAIHAVPEVVANVNVSAADPSPARRITDIEIQIRPYAFDRHPHGGIAVHINRPTMRVVA
jgi:hypothetical protein